MAAMIALSTEEPGGYISEKWAYLFHRRFVSWEEFRGTVFDSTMLVAA
jgi:hypothetical protein